MSIIIHSVDVHNNAKQDIRIVAASDKAAAATILAVLEQLKADPKTTMDKLTTHGDNYVGCYRLSVKRWETASKIGNLWRLRILDTPSTKYRVIYGYHWVTHQLCILAIVEKDNYDYDDLNTTINKRIISDWNAL